MSDDLSRLAADTSHFSGRYALNVLMACEDYSAGMHALGVFDRIFPSPDKKISRGAQSIWKFDMLGIATLREISAREAAAADLIIISMHGAGLLDATIKSWFRKWMAQRAERTGALVLLLDDIGGNPPAVFPVEALLKGCAARAGMEFFSHKVGDRCAFGDFEPLASAGKKAGIFATFREDLFGLTLGQVRGTSAR
jgi:hypothetical protein